MAFEDWAESQLRGLATGTALHRPSSHQSLFKYVGLNTKTSWQRLTETLNYFKLGGSTAQALNDPFELSPHIFDDLRPAVISSVLEDTGLKERLYGGRFDAKDKYADVDTYRKQARAYLGSLTRYYRIISFCERSDSPLLWSHYAQSYSGACLHFLGRAFFRRDATMGRVAYAPFRPTLPLSVPLGLALKQISEGRQSELRAEIERAYFFSKAIDWAYEGEIRIVYDSRETQSAPFSQDGLSR